MKLSPKCLLLSILWVAWFVLLPVPFVLAGITGNHGWVRHIWISSVVLSLASWSFFGFHFRESSARFAALIATGMTLGMLADIYGTCLARSFKFNALCVTVPLFALGHVGYIWGMLTAAKTRQLPRRKNWRAVLLISSLLYCLLGIALWAGLVHSSDKLQGMHLPTAGYTVFLALAAAVMAGVAHFNRRFLPMALGGFLFLLSDGFLAVALFQDNWHGIGDYCWITYGIGQMLIVYGAIFATGIPYRKNEQ